MDALWSIFSITSPVLVTCNVLALISASYQKWKKKRLVCIYASCVTGLAINRRLGIKLASLTVHVCVDTVEDRCHAFHLRNLCNAGDGTVGFGRASCVLVMASPLPLSTVPPSLPSSPAFLRLYRFTTAFSLFSVAKRTWGRNGIKLGNSTSSLRIVFPQHETKEEPTNLGFFGSWYHGQCFLIGCL